MQPDQWISTASDDVQVFHGLIDLPFPRCVLTIGNFDGVHLAHQKLIEVATSEAKVDRAPIVVCTFEPHPLSVISPPLAPTPITPLDRKMELLQRCGVDAVVVVPSEPSLFAMEAEDFIRKVVAPRFRPSWIVEGASFRFGKDRRGDMNMLTCLGVQCGFVTTTAPVVTMRLTAPLFPDQPESQNAVVSSSLVRALLVQGRVAEVNACLGRRFALASQVVTGDQRGARLGFPTANLDLKGLAIPGEGVYSGEAFVDGGVFACAISIGCNPTFDGRDRRVEVFLLDFQGDLRGRRLVVEFGEYLRAQRRFENEAELSRQIARDVDSVRERFAADHAA